MKESHQQEFSRIARRELGVGKEQRLGSQAQGSTPSFLWRSKEGLGRGLSLTHPWGAPGGHTSPRG